jgi:hypothetical protein
MENPVIAFGNVVDLAALSGGSWTVGQPQSNLLTLNPSQVARTANALVTSTKLRFTLSSAQLIQMFVLHNVNASPDASFRLRLYSDAAWTTLADDSEETEIYPQGSLPFGFVPWGSPQFWTAKPVLADLQNYQRNIYRRVPGAVYAQSGEFELFDTANPDGYFEAGRLFLGKVFQPQRGMAYGVSDQIKPRSSMSRSFGGTRYFDRQNSDISFPFTLPRLLESEARRVMDLQAEVDVSGEVFFLKDPSDITAWMGRSLFGQLAQLDAISNPTPGNYVAGFQIEGNLCLN